MGKHIIQWGIAFILSCMIANAVLFFYFRDPGWIKRTGGANAGIYEPETTIIRADEGYTVSNVDKNGYVNDNCELTDSGYVLVLGNSQSNGNNVMPDRKYVSKLSTMLQDDRSENQAMAYNVSVGGADYCDIVQGFEAAQEEFPDSDAIVIQIITTDLSIDKMKNMTEQRPFSEEMRGSSLINQLSVEQKVRNAVKDFAPLVVYTQEMKLAEWDFHFKDAFLYRQTVEEIGNDNKNVQAEDEYRFYLNQSMQFLRESYKKPIVILNLPGCTLMQDGTLKCDRQRSEEIFSELCDANDIIYCNMRDVFQKEYSEKAVLPYGFSNTRPGYGHLNEAGHKMVADKLYHILKESRTEK